MHYRIFCAFIFIFLLSSCSSNQITGLWTIENVQVGIEEMTPQARWVHFENNKLQKSGNGWQQHSVGTYDFNKSNQKLSIYNTNGIVDTFDPFQVEIDGSKMYWKRTEEGQDVTVTLSRIEQIPAAPGDQLLGLWSLEKAEENGTDVTVSYDPQDKRYLFLRWDKIFISRNGPKGTQRGVFQVNAHQPEVEMIYNDEECTRKRWQFEVTHERLLLKTQEDDQETLLQYTRIDHFPN